jgi:hypothetical protein
MNRATLPLFAAMGVFLWAPSTPLRAQTCNQTCVDTALAKVMVALGAAWDTKQSCLAACGSCTEAQYQACLSRWRLLTKRHGTPTTR